MASLGLHSKTCISKKATTTKSSRLVHLCAFSSMLLAVCGVSGPQGRPGRWFCVPPSYTVRGQASVLSGPRLFCSLKCQHPPPRTPSLPAVCPQQLSRTAQALRASGQLPLLPPHPEQEPAPQLRLLINSDLNSCLPQLRVQAEEPRSPEDSEELSISCRGKIDLSFPSSICSGLPLGNRCSLE